MSMPRQVLLWLALAAVYFGAAKLGLSLAFPAEQVTAVWPPTGIALAAVLLLPRGAWIGVFLGAFFANVTTHESAPVAMGIAAGNTLEAVVGAMLLRTSGFRPTLDRLQDVLALVTLGAVLSPIVSATIGTFSLCAGHIQPWSEWGRLWCIWWLGDMGGDILVAPLLLSVATHSFGGRVAHSGEAVVLVLALLTVCLAVFAGSLPPTDLHPLEYAVFPFIIWGALRFEQPGATTVTFLASAVALWGTVHGSGPFSRGSLGERLILLQSYMAAVALSGLLLSAAIADRRRVEEALRDADRRKDEFLAMLAHELRNPLAPILSSVAILQERVLPENRRPIEMIARQVRHMARLVDELLDVSRITEGKIDLQFETVDLRRIVEQAVETCWSLLDERGHDLTLSMPHDPIPVRADPPRLQQVVTNLLGNAARYTDPGGAIEIEAHLSKGWITLQIRDNGAGIAPDFLPHVFELFSQAPRSLARSEGGLGIGLTLAQEIAHRHGGEVTARSDGPGKGSEFTVTLPLSRDPVDLQATEPKPADLSRSAPHRVLLAEDQADVAESLVELLQLWGHEVRHVRTGEEAMAIARSFMPEVALLDIGLPGMDGFELARRLRTDAGLPGLRLIALSGYDSPPARQNSPFDAYLSKPAEPEQLRCLVEQVRSSNETDR